MDSIMEQGIQPYCHFDVWLNHRGVNRITKPHMHALELAKAQSGQSINQIIYISQEEMTRHNLTMDLKLKECEKNRAAREASEHKFLLKQEGDGIATPMLNAV